MTLIRGVVEPSSPAWAITPDSKFKPRHLQAIDQARLAIDRGIQVLEQQAAGELLAEELRSAHDALAEITGKVTSDQLLGEIFSSFCIGK